MNEEIKEIQELKEELAALHRKIDEQAEIKDSMIKKAVAGSISKLQKIGNSSFWICIIALILLEAIVFSYGLSAGIKIATLVNRLSMYIILQICYYTVYYVLFIIKISSAHSFCNFLNLFLIRVVSSISSSIAF